MGILKNLKERYIEGFRKATLERAARSGPCVGGPAGTEEIANEIYAPFVKLTQEAKNILPPKGLVLKTIFNLGYKSAS